MTEGAKHESVWFQAGIRDRVRSGRGRAAPSTWGLAAFKDAISPRTAVAVERLESAGAIVVGKTNVPVMLGDWESYNPILRIARVEGNGDALTRAFEALHTVLEPCGEDEQMARGGREGNADAVAYPG
jgi:hypothetical protein